jgi:hypothetical protein
MFRRILVVAVFAQLLFSSISLSQTPPHLWSQRFGDGSDQYASSVAVDAWGNVIVTGHFSGSVDFGGGVLTSEGLEDIFVAKFGPNGNHLWSKRFGGFYDQTDGDQRGESVVVDMSGNVIATGCFKGTADFGGGPLTSAGVQDIFVVKFDAAGNHLWSKRFGDAAQEAGKGVAVDEAGNVVVTGYFHSTVDFGGGTLASAGSSDIFVAKFDAAGDHLWSKRFGDGDVQAPYSVAMDGAGDVVVTGDLSGTVDFGGGPLTSEISSDVFLAKFDAAGNHLWSKRFGNWRWQIGTSVAMDESGNVVATGRFQGTVDFGGGLLTSARATSDDIFLVKFDPNGNHLWSKRFGDQSYQRGAGVAIDGWGNVIVTGDFEGTVDFGGGALTSAGYEDIFVVEFSSNGSLLWRQRFGDQSRQSGTSVAVDAWGNVVVTGGFQGIVDFGGGSLTSAGMSDIYLTKFGLTAVPTLLQSFAARYGESGIEVTWEMSEPAIGIDFHVFRKSTTDPQYQELQAPRISEQGGSFTFVDSEYEAGLSYRYRVDASDANDRWTLFETEPIATPSALFALFQNSPNPFNPTTTIRYSVPGLGVVGLRVYDASGRLVRVLVDEQKPAGQYAATWDGRDVAGHLVASGVYFCRLEAGGVTQAKKLVLLK